MEIRAKAKYIRISPRKVRLVLDVIRGLKVEEALEQLQFISKRASQSTRKLLNSAIASAKHNFGLEKENLYIKEIAALSGPTLKRWRPRAFGRAAAIRKRSSHILIVLDELKPTQAKIKREKLSQEIQLKEIKRETKKEFLAPGKEIPKPKEELFAPEIFDLRRKGKHRAKEHLDKKRLERAKRLERTKGFIKKIFTRKAV